MQQGNIQEDGGQHQQEQVTQGGNKRGWTKLLPFKRSAPGLPPIQTTPKRGRNGKKAWVWEQYNERRGEFVCKHCQSSMSGRNATRMKEHLMNPSVCRFIYSEQAKQMNIDEVNAVLDRIANGQQIIKQRNKQTAVSAEAVSVSINIMQQQQERLQKMFADMVYETNLPHDWVEQKPVQDFFHELRPSFALPNRSELSNQLLFSSFWGLQNQVKSVLEESEFVTLTSDGWSKAENGINMVNFQAYGFGQSYFLDVNACNVNDVSSEFVLNEVNNVINKHELETKITAFVTDATVIMKPVQQSLEQKFEGLIYFGCFCSVISQFFSSVYEIQEINLIVGQVKQIWEFSERNSTLHDLLINDGGEQFGQSGAGLEQNFQLLSNILNFKLQIQNAVQQFTMVNDLNIGDMQRIVIDTEFWLDIQFIHDLLHPFALELLHFQTEYTTIANSYFAWTGFHTHIHKMHEIYQNSGKKYQPLFEKILELFEHFRNYGWNDAFILAALLDPRYYNQIHQIQQTERITAESMCKQFGGIQALNQLSQLRNNRQCIHIPDHAYDPGMTSEPLLWWKDYGNTCPVLQQVAYRVLSVPTQTVFGLRNLSGWKKILDKSPSRLLATRVGMLIFIYINSRILGKIMDPDPLDWDEFLEEICTMDEINVEMTKPGYILNQQNQNMEANTSNNINLNQNQIEDGQMGQENQISVIQIDQEVQIGNQGNNEGIGVMMQQNQTKNKNYQNDDSNNNNDTVLLLQPHQMQNNDGMALLQQQQNTVLLQQQQMDSNEQNESGQTMLLIDDAILNGQHEDQIMQ